MDDAPHLCVCKKDVKCFIVFVAIVYVSDVLVTKSDITCL